MDLIKRFMNGERGRVAALGRPARMLLLSYGVGELAAPVFDIFINVFLWRHFQGFAAPVIYNLGRFIGLPVGFYLNAFFLRRFPSATMYFFGTVAQAAAIAGIIFLSPHALSTVLAAAVIYGIGNGIYWSNRNFLTVASSREENRNYFVSLELASKKVIGILSPAAIGWLIHSTEIFGAHSIDVAYRWIGVGAFFLQLACGYLVARMSYPTPDIRHIFVRKPDRPWKLMRRFAFIGGGFQGVNFFFGTFIVLALIGREGELGFVRALGTLATAVLLYWIGQSETAESRPRILQAGIWTIFAGAMLLAVLYSPFAAVAYIILTSLGTSLFSQSWDTIFYDAADGKGLQQEMRYARIFDHEIFLNVGRAVGTLIFLGLLLVVGQDFTLRFLPLFMISLQFLVVPLAKTIGGIGKESVVPAVSPAVTIDRRI